MRVRALCGFAGAACMAPGEVREVSDELARDLIRAGYAVGPLPAEPVHKPDLKKEKLHEAERADPK